MPYRNVYEEKNQRLSRGTSEEPEKNPRKIAEIYRSQMPSADDLADTAQKLKAAEERKANAYVANRGIRK